MSKVFLAMFGGTPARGELCLYLNAAAGLYQNCEGIRCYPIDKDIESPNYVNTRDVYNQYMDFRQIAADWKKMGEDKFDVASVDIVRTEDMFGNMLKDAVKDRRVMDEESIRYLMSDEENGISPQEQRILDICFTREEQEEKMRGGYFGRADIGSITGDILKERGVYKNLDLYQDIKKEISAGHELDVVVVCSSFGGTGASFGINFGEYLRKEFENEEQMHIHCIFIQPYFSFPAPEETDPWGIDCNNFYAKSATAATILGQKENLISEKGNKAVFDRFYYLGQEVLDNISDGNSAMSHQDNRIHMVDMLVSLAVQDILLKGEEKSALQLYGYQYSNEGTEFLTWKNMPVGIRFKTKHVCMMRFCEFMLDCMAPLFADDYPNYAQETLMVHLYGRKGGILSKTANIEEGIKVRLHSDMRKCFEFCKSYVKYWIQLEENTKFGFEQTSVTRFFNLDELRRILNNGEADYLEVRFAANSLNLTQVKECDNYKSGKTCLNIYDSLCRDRRLKGIASPGNGKENVAKILTEVIYDTCKVEDYKSLQD